MRAIRMYVKSNCYLLILITLFQSCVVYHKTPVTLEQAAQQEIKTKITLRDGRIKKFKSITQKDNQYFGKRKTGKGLVSISVDADSISKIQVKNKAASILVTVIPLAALTALVIAGSNFSTGFGGY